MGQCVRWWSPKRRARRPSATCKAVQRAFVISFITALAIHSSGVCGENSASSSLVLHNHPPAREARPWPSHIHDTAQGQERCRHE
jgi:hypothetical protein